MRGATFRRRYVGVCMVLASGGAALLAVSTSRLVYPQAAEAPPQSGSNSETGGANRPSVLAYSARAAGIELHLTPGQYHPSFDDQIVPSFPYVSASADSSPFAMAAASPAELGSLADNYTSAGCLITTFAPYCDEIQMMPVDTFSTRATSDAAKSHDASTSFPCQPGRDQSKQVAIGFPSCPYPMPSNASLGDGSAHADAAPAARAVARLGHLEVIAPSGAMAAYRSRLNLAHQLLRAAHRTTTGVDRASASGSLLTLDGITATVSYELGRDGYPVAHESTTFHNVDALGGLLHADAVTLDVLARTLGEAQPLSRVETAHMMNLRAEGTSYGDVDLSNCEKVGQQINNSRPPVPGGSAYGFSAYGFHFTCATDTSSVVTDKSKGYGLNPVKQELAGPGFDLVQMQNPARRAPSTRRRRAAGLLPGPGRSSGATAGSGIASQAPPTPGPTSTCQFVSTNSFANNGLSLHFGHLAQGLAAQPPLAEDISTATGVLAGSVANGSLGLGGGSGSGTLPDTAGGSVGGVTAGRGAGVSATQPTAQVPARPSGVILRSMPDW